MWIDDSNDSLVNTNIFKKKYDQTDLATVDTKQQSKNQLSLIYIKF